MHGLVASHDKEVGTALKKKDPKKYKDYIGTDCITFCIRVMSYAFEQMNKPLSAKKVRGWGNMARISLRIWRIRRGG